MPGTKEHANEPDLPTMATLTSIPKDVLQNIVDRLDGNDRVNLALCCKRMLPTLCMGAVDLRLDKPGGKKLLTQLSRCLAKQPNGVSHLTLFSHVDRRGTRKLIDLSLLSNLRGLSLNNVDFSLSALQPVATRMQTLDIMDSRLRGSADGFLSAGWTALRYLCLEGSWVEDDALTAVNLPALKELNIMAFEHQGGMLQLDQLCCPQLRKLACHLDSSQERASEGSRQRFNLLHLTRLAGLNLMCRTFQATTDLALPASLEYLTVQDANGSHIIDLKWVLLEAIKSIRSGAQLRSLTCADTMPSSHPEGVLWGPSSIAHYTRLGERLKGLKDLAVHGSATTLLSAIGAVACSAPHLTCLWFHVEEELDDLELPPISSASLKSITMLIKLTGNKVPPPPVVLTFLPGCTQLRDVRVQLHNSMPKEGTCVKIRCHCTSQRCIMPSDACAGLDEVGVRFLQVPPSSQGVQAYTVIFMCHAAEPEQALKWIHVVMPGDL